MLTFPATALAAAVVLLASLVRPGNAVTCYPGVNVFTARGTTEVPPTGLGIEGVHINAILAAIPGSNATVVEYPASFDNNSISIGVQNGTRQLEAYLDACPTSQVVVMGYSQGAIVQGYVLTGATLGVSPDGSGTPYTVPPLPSKYANQVVAIVFFGDPFFNFNIGINSDAPYPCNVSAGSPRTGALWESYGPRLEEWCNYSDVVCCSTGSTFDGHISYFSGANGTITANFVAGKYAAAVGGSNSTTTSSVSGSVTSSKPSGTCASTGLSTGSGSAKASTTMKVVTTKASTTTKCTTSETTTTKCTTSETTTTKATTTKATTTKTAASTGFSKPPYPMTLSTVAYTGCESDAPKRRARAMRTA